MRRAQADVREDRGREHLAFVAILFVIALLLFLVPGRSQAQPQGDLLPLTVGHQPIVPWSTAMVAAGKGFFTQVGLRVERKVVPGSDVIRSGLESGEIGVGGSSLDALVRAHVAGFDFKLVYPAVFYDPRSPDAYIVVRSDLAVTTAKDLEGKTVALTFGTIADVGPKAWLRANGADISKVRFVEVRFPDMVGALETKRIDAAHIVEPFLTAALDRGIARILGPDLDIIGGRFVVAGYIAKDSWLRANPEKARRFTQAMERATKFILENPQESIQVISKETRLEPGVVAKFFPKRFVAATQVKPEELQRTIDFLAREQFIDKTFNFREMISDFVPIVR